MPVLFRGSYQSRFPSDNPVLRADLRSHVHLMSLPLKQWASAGDAFYYMTVLHFRHFSTDGSRSPFLHKVHLFPAVQAVLYDR